MLFYCVFNRCISPTSVASVSKKLAHVNDGNTKLRDMPAGRYSSQSDGDRSRSTTPLRDEPVGRSPSTVECVNSEKELGAVLKFSELGSRHHIGR